MDQCRASLAGLIRFKFFSDFDHLQLSVVVTSFKPKRIGAAGKTSGSGVEPLLPITFPALFDSTEDISLQIEQSNLNGAAGLEKIPDRDSGLHGNGGKRVANCSEIGMAAVESPSLMTTRSGVKRWMIFSAYAIQTLPCASTVISPGKERLRVSAKMRFPVTNCQYSDRKSYRRQFLTSLRTFLIVTTKAATLPSDLQKITSPNLKDDWKWY